MTMFQCWCRCRELCLDNSPWVNWEGISGEQEGLKDPGNISLLTQQFSLENHNQEINFLLPSFSLPPPPPLLLLPLPFFPFYSPPCFSFPSASVTDVHHHILLREEFLNWQICGLKGFGTLWFVNCRERT